MRKKGKKIKKKSLKKKSSIIRKKVKEGHTENEIYKFLTDRYGDFILLKPPFKLSTFALWFLPLIFFVIGIFIVFFHNKKSKQI